MDHFAGLDVSVNETSVCIVDNTGRIIREAKVASEPDALLQVLKNGAYHFYSDSKSLGAKSLTSPSASMPTIRFWVLSGFGCAF